MPELSFEEWCEKEGFDPETFRDVKCISCGRTARQVYEEDGPYAVEDGEWIDDYGEYDYAYEDTAGSWLCYGCYEDETAYPVAKATVFGKHLLTLYEDFYFIAEDEVEDDGWYEVLHGLAEELHKAIYWVRTDPWRGYYEIDKSKLRNWILLADDAILAGSEDAEELEKFDEELRELIEDRGGVWARVTLTTSNLFAAGYTLLVKKDSVKPDALAALQLAALVLRLRYRDPVRFAITALTGKTRTSEFTREDRLLLEAYRRLKSGEDPDKVYQDIAGRLGA